MEKFRAVYQNRYFFYDILLILSSLLAGFWLRFGSKHILDFLDSLSFMLLLVLIVKPIVFSASGMYGEKWIDSSGQKIVLLAGIVSSSLLLLGIILVLQVSHFSISLPRSVLYSPCHGHREERPFHRRRSSEGDGPHAGPDGPPDRRGEDTGRPQRVAGDGPPPIDPRLSGRSERHPTQTAQERVEPPPAISLLREGSERREPTSLAFSFSIGVRVAKDGRRNHDARSEIGASRPDGGPYTIASARFGGDK